MATATALRRRGHTGLLTVIGNELETPYDRPPLSKQLLAGEWAADRLELLPRQRLRDLNLDLRLGTSAVALDIGDKSVLDHCGVKHEFDAAVIATGLTPRTLPGLDMAGVHVLRTLGDALSLSASITASTRFVIIGAGFLGLEVAATARHRGASVTVVEPLEHPLASRLGPTAARMLLELHHSRGVQVRTSSMVTEISAGDSRRQEAGDAGAQAPHVRRVFLDDGTNLPADVVLIAIGAAPCTSWLQSSGLDVGDGITCDEYCRAAPSVWAVGDVARWFHRAVDSYLRLEHRTNATEQAQAVAADILGNGKPFVPVPFFWTDHYQARVQVAGLVPAEGSGESAEPQPGPASHVFTFHDRGVLSGVLGWNASPQLMPYRKALRAQYDLAVAS